MLESPKDAPCSHSFLQLSQMRFQVMSVQRIASLLFQMMQLCWPYRCVNMHWSSLQSSVKRLGGRSAEVCGHGSLPEKGGLFSLVEGELLTQAEEFKYLRVVFTIDGKMECEMDRKFGKVTVVM